MRRPQPISSLAVTSNAGEDDTYGVGDEIEVTLTFDEDVTVTGTPQLEINVGGTAKTASYSGTDGAQVTFTYTVAAGDLDTDGIEIEANKLSLNGGTINDEADNSADLNHDDLAAQSSHKVDTVAPTVSSIAITSVAGNDETYAVGDEIEVTVTFSEDVTVTGMPQLEVDVGGTAKAASYSETDGAQVAVGYTVAAGDLDTDGISIEANKLSLNGGTIKDAAGNSADLDHVALAAQSSHKVEAIVPTVSSIAVTSATGEDGAYGLGDDIVITVTLSENVTVTGTPQLEIDVGGTAGVASYARANDNQLLSHLHRGRGRRWIQTALR